MRKEALSAYSLVDFNLTLMTLDLPLVCTAAAASLRSAFSTHPIFLHTMSGMNSSEIDDLISANMASGSGAGSAVLSGEGSGSAGVAGFNPEEAQNDESVRTSISPLCVQMQPL